MTPIADMIESMLAEGADMKLVLLAVRAIEAVAAREHSGGIPVDKTAEKRRAWDRERKRKSGGIPVESGGIPQSAYIEEPIKVKKKKDIYIPADEVPVEVPADAETFASLQGWGGDRVVTEWQRFRDHGIAKARKHHGEKGLLAAWRNWVRSPFQQPDKPPDKTGRPLVVDADQRAAREAKQLAERRAWMEKRGAA